MTTENKEKLLKQAVTEPLKDEEIEDIAGGSNGYAEGKAIGRCAECNYKGPINLLTMECPECGSHKVQNMYLFKK